MTMWTDDLSSLAAWTTANSPQTANGKMYGSFAGEQSCCAQRSITVGSTPAKFLVNMQYVDRGNDLVGDFFGIYLTDKTAATVQGGDHTHLIGIFISMTFNDGRHVNVNFNGTVFQDFSPTSPGQFIPSGNANYLAGILLDETYVSLFLRKSDGSAEWRWACTRASLGFTPNAVGMIIEDNRGQTGSAFESAGWRDDSLDLITPTATLEGLTQSQFSVDATAQSGIVDGQQFRVSIPSNYSSAKGAPAVIYCHGASGKYGEIQDTAFTLGNQLLSNGWFVCSHQAHGDSFGNSTSSTDVNALYTWLKAHFNITKVAVIGFSMGGLVAANSIRDGTIPYKAVVFSSSGLNMAWIGDFPSGVVLAGTTNQQSFKSVFETAYSLGDPYSHATYLANTAGHDPLLFSASTWAPLKFLVIASPADTLVDKTQNSDLLVSTLASQGKVASTSTASGDHGDASQLNPAVIIPFLTGAFAASLKYSLDPLDPLTPLNKTTF